MVIEENLVIYRDNKCVLFNLINFKVTEISSNSINLLKEYIDTGIGQGKELYTELKRNRQFLTKEEIKKIDLCAKIGIKKKLNKRNNSINTIQISFSYNCNLNCFYCYQKDMHITEKLNFQDINSIYDFCNLYDNEMGEKCKEKLIVISGGEPLLNENIEKINYTAKKFINSQLYIYTNGINLLRLWDLLPLKNIKGFQFSLDGNDNIISRNSLDGSSSLYFKDIIGGIHKAIKFGYEVKINSVITQTDFFEEAIQLISILEEEDIITKNNVSINFSSIVDPSTKMGISDDYELINFIEHIYKFTKYVSKYSNIVLSFFPDIKKLSSILSGKFDLDKLNLGLSCGHNNGIALNFTPDGSVYWCSELIKKGGKIGDFKKQNIDIGRIKLINNRNIFVIDKCKNCLYRYICNTGCSLRIGASGTDWNSEYCGIFSNTYILDNIGKII